MGTINTNQSALDTYSNRALGVLGLGMNIGTKVGSYISGNGASAMSIRDKLTNGFISHNSVFKPSFFARQFDEPTYLTFRVEFEFPNYKDEYNGDYAYEPYRENSDIISDRLYGKAFENIKKEKEYHSISLKTLHRNPSSPFVDINKKIRSETELASNNNFNYMIEPLLGGMNNTDYSTLRYLYSNVGDYGRFSLLCDFREGLQDLQTNFPYYITTITGLNELTKISPERGRRLGNDAKLTFQCMEGLDLKITQLIQLYRKIIWDDVYQRWILPDMMRYFSMKIYVSEIRLFHHLKGVNDKLNFDLNFLDPNDKNKDYLNAKHTPTKVNNTMDSVNRLLNTSSAISTNFLGTESAVTSAINTAGGLFDFTSDAGDIINGKFLHLCNSALNDVMPTLCFDCRMCEFDIEDTMSYLSELSSSAKDPQNASFTIKVGQVYESQIYPLNRKLALDTKGRYTLYTDSENHATYLDDHIMSIMNRDETNTSEYLKREFTNTIPISSMMRRVNETLDVNDDSSNNNLSYYIFRENPDTKVISAKLSNGGLANLVEDIEDMANSSADAAESFGLNVRSGNARSTATHPTRKRLGEIMNPKSVMESQQYSGSQTISSNPYDDDPVDRDNHRISLENPYDNDPTERTTSPNTDNIYEDENPHSHSVNRNNPYDNDETTSQRRSTNTQNAHQGSIYDPFAALNTNPSVPANPYMDDITSESHKSALVSNVPKDPIYDSSVHTTSAQSGNIYGPQTPVSKNPSGNPYDDDITTKDYKENLANTVNSANPYSDDITTRQHKEILINTVDIVNPYIDDVTSSEYKENLRNRDLNGNPYDDDITTSEHKEDLLSSANKDTIYDDEPPRLDVRNILQKTWESIYESSEIRSMATSEENKNKIALESFYQTLSTIRDNAENEGDKKYVEGVMSGIAEFYSKATNFQYKKNDAFTKLNG